MIGHYQPEHLSGPTQATERYVFMKDPGVTFFHPRHLSQKLMRVVFAIYLSITVLITCLQFATEYQRTQNNVLGELEVLEKTFHSAFETSLWQMNESQIEVLANGLISMPVIDGVDILNPNGKPVASLRGFSPEEEPLSLFSTESNLSWTLNNTEIPLGILRLYSSSEVIADRVLFGFILIVLNTVIKAAILWALLLWAFRRFLGRPLKKLMGKLNEINLEHIGDNKIELGIQDVNEFKSLEDRFNNMLLRIKKDREALIVDEEKRRRWLQKEVVTRTRELQESNEKLMHLASTDALTGILNRRVFFDQSQFHIDLSLRQKTPLCLLVLDIDNFKTINDTFGHAAGDRVLCQFTDLIAAKLRKTDIFGRVGGEEFAIMLIDTDLKAATIVAEKLRECVFYSKVAYKTREIDFSVSIGVSQYRENDESIEDFFVRSDNLLYKAKDNGRNRVEIQTI